MKKTPSTEARRIQAIQPVVDAYFYGYPVRGPQLGCKSPQLLQLPFLQVLSSAFQSDTGREAVPVQIDSDIALLFHVSPLVFIR